MTRKILFIIIGALLFLALLALLWFWFLNRSPAADSGNPSGFGTSSDRGGQSTGTNTTGGNQGDPYTINQTADGYLISSANGLELVPGTYQLSSGGKTIGAYRLGTNAGRITLTPRDINGVTIRTGKYTFTLIGVGSDVDINYGGQIDTTTGSSSIGTQIGFSASTTNTQPITGGINSGAWVGSTVLTRDFTPAQINQINSNSGISGTPLISTTPQAAGLGTSGLILGLTAAGCLAQYLAYEISGNVQAVTDGPKSLAGAGPYVTVFDFNSSAKQNNTKFKSIEQCLVKTIAKAAIDQITRSVVTWINSGFNGQPSFVTNFNQYFANVADQAAGEFIKGSALSFLCSPFAPQIKIAIAQSYANRNSGASCSLSKITNNINGFMRGSFGSGGWSNLMQFTTIPTNNPYGAYAYAQVGLSGAVSNAQNNANRNVSPGGFISLQKCDNLPAVNAGTGAMPTNNKNCKVTTPGAVIEDSLKTSLKAPIDGLNLAQNINDIITALANQVMTKALYGGLGNSLGVTNPLAPAIDQNASNQAQALLSQLQTSLAYAGQYASVQQGSISDIQSSQASLNAAYNCWRAVASTSPGYEAMALQKAADDDAAIAQLESRIDVYNSAITRVNSSLAVTQNMQSQVLFAATPEDVRSAAALIQQGAAQGAFIVQADVTTAQQNRTTLQTELAARNQQTSAELAECRAIRP